MLDATRRSAMLTETILIVVTGVVTFVGVDAEYEQTKRADMPPYAGAMVLVVLATGLLLLRRRFPVGTPAAMLGLCLVYQVAGYPGLGVAAPMYPACYSLVSNGRGWRSLAVGSALALGMPLSALVPPYQPEGINWAAISGVTVSLVALLAAAEAKRAWSFAAEQQLLQSQQAARDESDRRVAAERLLIARELHDVLAHTITLISVQAAAGLDAGTKRPEVTEAALRNIRGAAKDAMAELRSTVRVLRESPATKPADPQPSLDQLPQLVDLARAADIDAELEIIGTPVDVPVAVELAAYRIVQEALTNVIRHSGAAHATVRIEYLPESLLVSVTDDGSSPSEFVAGHGMIGMRERARAAGGTFSAGPGPTGFTVQARLEF